MITRYFVETNWKHKTCAKIHEHAMGWHAVALDDSTIFGKVHFMPHTFNVLKEHPHIVLLPSMHEQTPVYEFLTARQRHEHWAALEKYGITKTDTLAAAVRKICDKSGNTLLEFET